MRRSKKRRTAGLFIRSTMQRSQLYFAITGHRISNSETADVTMQVDEYVHNHVVGDKIPGLSLYKIEVSAH